MVVSDAKQRGVGLVGLEAIGRNVALRLAEFDFNVAAYDWRRPKTMALPDQTAGPKVRLAANVPELMASLPPPRTILIFSGPDASMNFVLDQLLPALEFGDLLMDAGDSYFKDTARQGRRLEEHSIRFMGLGLTGGERGARDGANVMAGGAREDRARTRPLLEAMAASVRGEPCVSYLEDAAAAHFVKMVHAGIEYALWQLLSETFGLLHAAALLPDEEPPGAPGSSHINMLHGHLHEMSGRPFEPVNKQTTRLLLDEKLESARNDPLGKWAAQSAWELEVPIPTIEAAVGTPLIAAAQRRQALASAPFRQPVGRFGDDARSVLQELHAALHAGMMIAYAQGLALLEAASKKFGFQFILHEITRAWRGCTHLRTTLLDNITAAFQATPGLPGLLSDADLSEGVMACQESLRHAVWHAHKLDIVVPAMLASLDYLDADRSAWLPANLIPAPPRPPGSSATRSTPHPKVGFAAEL
jgi:6-phosphogluconate dehydrogenase